MHTALGSYLYYKAYHHFQYSTIYISMSCFCILNVYSKTHLHILIEIQFEGEKTNFEGTSAAAAAALYCKARQARRARASKGKAYKHR